jgi:hypothetical protein
MVGREAIEKVAWRWLAAEACPLSEHGINPSSIPLGGSLTNRWQHGTSTSSLRLPHFGDATPS